MAGFSIPTASANALGLIKVGAGLSITAGVLAATGAASPATTTTLGSVIVPTSGRLAVDGSGNISVPLASSTVFGAVKVDNASIVSVAGVISATGAASPATTITLGAVIVPTTGHLAVDGSGNISVAIAAAATLGVVQVPTSHGLSVDGSGNVAVALATGAAAGTVIVPTANGLSVTAGSVAVALATGVVAGTVIVPTANGLSVTAGSVAVALATGAAAGTVIVPTANGLSISAGSIALALATSTTAGSVIVPTSGNLAVDGSGNVTVPLGSSSVFGVLKVDGTTITASSGVISAAGASGSLVLIATRSANNTSPDLAWTGLNTYANYLLVVDNLISATDGDDAILQFGTGAGPTYLTSTYDEHGVFSAATNSVINIAGAGSGFSLTGTNGINNAAASGDGASGDCFLLNMPCNGTAITKATGRFGGQFGGNPSALCAVSYIVGNTTAKTAVRIHNSAAHNWLSGAASLYGIVP